MSHNLLTPPPPRSVRFATFFRDVNVGRAGSPTTAHRVAAFEAAGRGDGATFLTQGNAVFSASQPT